MKGWDMIGQYRDITKTWIWDNPAYLKWWLDLVFLATYKDTDCVRIGNIDVETKRGELVASQKFLAKRWNTTESKVHTFTDKLLRDKYISIRYTNPISVIYINDYNSEKSCGLSDGLSDGLSNGLSDCLPAEIQQDTEVNLAAHLAVNLAVDTAGYLPNLNNIKNIKKENNINLSNERFVLGTADDTSFSANDSEKIDFKKLLCYWNTKMQGKVIPCIRGVENRRKTAIKARVKEYGKQAIVTVIDKAAESNFLNNGNFDFDWIFRPNNFPKVLEGKYDNNRRPQQAQSQQPQKPTMFDTLNSIFNNGSNTEANEYAAIEYVSQN